MMLYITSPSATSFVDRLVQLGYVRRKQDRSNRKLVRLSITETGKKILRKKMAEKKKIFATLLASLSSQEQALLLDLLTTVLRNTPSA